MIRYFCLLAVVFVLSDCSLSKGVLYDDGDLKTVSFTKKIASKKLAHNGYYKVVENKNGQILSVKEYDAKNRVRSRTTQKWKKEALTSRRIESFFLTGGKQAIKISRFKYGGKKTSETQIWYNRNGSFESRDELEFDGDGREIVKETFTIGRVLTSSKEIFYDYEGRLDKEKRYYFNKDGDVLDYWTTIYDNREHIINEEHYLPNGTLVAFYRYTYNPTNDYKEMEEVLDVELNRFIIRYFNSQGSVLKEEIRNRQMQLKKKYEFEYNDEGDLVLEKSFDAAGKLVSKRKPKNELNFRGLHLVRKY